jgi:hypothetical protein
MVLADLITKLAGESPVLSRSSHIFLRGAVYQVSTDLTYPQGSQTALALEEDDVHNIMQLRGFGPVAHVSQAHSPTDLDEKRNQWLDLMMSSVVGILVGSMPKQKSSAQFHVADGTGGMRQVADLRFEPGEWPIELVV